MTTTHRRLFSHPVDAILAALPAVDDPIWTVHAKRQQAYDAHNQTRSIVFAWPHEDADGGYEIEAQWYAPVPLAIAVLAVGERLKALYQGRIVRLMLAELPVGARILSHRDTGDLLTRVHRCHLPIVTDPQVTFLIDGKHRPLDVGEAYEIDNTRIHAVANASDRPRIHLICDIMPTA